MQKKQKTTGEIRQNRKRELQNYPKIRQTETILSARKVGKV